MIRKYCDLELKLYFLHRIFALGRYSNQIKEEFSYIFFQILGALFASGLLSILSPENTTLGGKLPSGGLVIGLTVTFLILVAGPISGGSFNPARSITPTIFPNNFTAIWIYLVAPILGAVLASVTWKELED